jgi:predicted transcriptional regulator
MGKNKKIFDVIFREKPVMMLVELRNAGAQAPMYASTLAKKVDCTYSHVVKILQEMNKSGIVAFQKQGRLKILTLTKKGQEIAENLDKVRTTL